MRIVRFVIIYVVMNELDFIFCNNIYIKIKKPPLNKRRLFISKIDYLLRKRDLNARAIGVNRRRNFRFANIGALRFNQV